MDKLISTLLSLFFLVSSFSVKAFGMFGDSTSRNKGLWRYNAIIISGGTGFVNNEIYFNRVPANVEGYDISSATPGTPVFGKIEFYSHDKIGFGATINRSSIDLKYLDKKVENTINWSIFTINIRVNYHFFEARKYDVYWGAGLGLKHSNYKFPDGKSMADQFVHFGFETTVGARFAPVDFFGFYAEVGYGRALAQVGIFINPGVLK